MKRLILTTLLILVGGICLVDGMQTKSKSKSQEPSEKKYRILSISIMENIILISDLDTKKRLMLDIAKAKIFIDKKESDLKTLQKYSAAFFQIRLSPTSKRGHDLDGQVTRVQLDSRQ